jgi:hypothetical protein
MALVPLLVLTGCAYLVEQRTLPDEVEWSGYVYAGVPGDEVPLLETGLIEVLDADGAPLDGAEARQDYPDTLGYWTLAVPVDTPVTLRLSGDGVVPTVWRGHTPSGRAYWLNGALFARGEAETDALVDALDGLDDRLPGDPDDGAPVHLVGQPWDREDVAGATWTATGGDGAEVRVHALVADDSGALSDAADGPVDLVVALDLAPGTATLRCASPDGRSAETHWPTQAGDLVSAMWFHLPEAAAP